MSFKYIVESEALDFNKEYEYLDEQIIDDDFIDTIVADILDESFISEEAYSNYTVIPQGTFVIDEVEETLKRSALEYIDNIGDVIELTISCADRTNVIEKIDIKSLIKDIVQEESEYGEFNAKISSYVEDCLFEFQNQSEWEIEKIGNEEFILRYGAVDKKDLSWCIDTRESIDMSFWFEEEPWEQLERIGFRGNDTFLIWYTAECGCAGIDMEKIRCSCPIEISRADNKYSIIEKCNKMI